MSNKAINWAKTFPDMSTAEKMTLFLISDYYNEKQHRSWPSVARIAEEGCLNERTVKRAIASLAAKLVIDVEPWVTPGGKRLNNRYCLPMHDPASIVSETLPYVYKGQRGEEEDADEDLPPLLPQSVPSIGGRRVA